MDLRLTIQEEIVNKPLGSRWVTSHRDIAKAKTKEEAMEIKRTNEVGCPTKMATGLPLPEYTPTCPGDITAKASPAPTPANKWITEKRHYDIFLGTHWVSWLPLKGTRRMIWANWLWGNEQWDGCGAPWDHNVVRCPLCNNKHGTIVHKRLVQRLKWALAFRTVWTQSWGPWDKYAEEWYNNAPPEDLHHFACLRIPQSFYDQLPVGYGGQVWR